MTRWALALPAHHQLPNYDIKHVEKQNGNVQEGFLFFGFDRAVNRARRQVFKNFR